MSTTEKLSRNAEILSRNAEILAAELTRLLEEQSKPGYHGNGGLRWQVRDGIVQAEVVGVKEERRKIS